MIDYLRTLLLFYRRHLRVQPLRELMAIVGVAAGVALLFAVQVAHRSITGSFEEVAHGVAGRATLELAARTPEGFDQRVSEEVQRMPGVKASAPIFQQPIVAIGPNGRRALTLVGATPQIISLKGNLALQFQRAGARSLQGLLILTEPIARAIGGWPGHTITVLVGTRTEHLPVNATVPSEKIGAMAESPVAAAPLPIVQALAGLPHRITRILIQPRPGREAVLRRELTNRFSGNLNVRSIETEAKLLGAAAGPERQVALLFSAISLVAGVILAYNALLLASDERRRFSVYLIETGTPDSMIAASLAFDALILGVTGAILGLLVGDVISLLAYRSVPGYIAAAFSIGGQRVIDTQTIIIALGGGLLAAFAAATLPAISILRAGTAAEPDAAGPTLSFVRKLRFSDTLIFSCGALLIAFSTATSALWPAMTVATLIGFTIGLVVCLPMMLRCLLRVVRSVSRHSNDPAARLSVAELCSSPTRSVALLATGTIAVFLMVLIGGSVSDVQRAVRRGAADLLSSANIWIKPGGPENVYTTQPFAYAQTQHRLQRLSVVSSIAPWRDSFLDLPSRRVWVLGVPPQTATQIAPSQLIEGSLNTADRRIREGGWVAISQPIAREDHLHIGDWFTIPTPTGNARVRIAATTANYGWLSGAIVMNADEHTRLWRSTTASQLAITLKPGIPLEQGRRAIEAALPLRSALAVETVNERRSEVSAVLGSTLSRLNETTIVVLVATIASVVALMVAAISQRRGRLDSLMSIGMSTGQFAKLVFYETGSLLLGGSLIGMVAGLVGQYLIDGWLHHTTGSPVTFTPAWQLGLRTVVVVAGISVVASMIVVIQTGRFQPRSAFSTE